MADFVVKMKHTEETLVALSHMQYDLFCQRNRYVRYLISAAAILFGLWKYSNWWGIFAIGYGCYLITSTYSSSNRTAHRLAAQIREAKMDFPSSKFVFENRTLRIFSLPEEQEINDPLPFSQIARMGEDGSYFYIFRDQYGGYMIPKEALGDKCRQFREFMEKESGQVFSGSRSPFRQLLANIRKRENEPYHL